jgi:hypothetical protein
MAFTSALQHLPNAVRGEPALLRQPQPRLIYAGMLTARSQVPVESLRGPGPERHRPVPLPVTGVALAFHSDDSAAQVEILGGQVCQLGSAHSGVG